MALPTRFPKDQIAAIVLCGGRSRRMGRDKATLRIGDETFLERICRELGDSFDTVIAVGSADQQFAIPPPATWLADCYPDQGPVAGIASGLEHLAPRYPWAFVTSCDVPLISPRIVDQLWQHAADCQAVIPTDGRHLYGLTALYQTALAPILFARIAAGERRVADLPSAIEARQIELAQLAAADPELASVRNINSPEDYLRLLSDRDKP